MTRCSRGGRDDRNVRAAISLERRIVAARCPLGNCLTAMRGGFVGPGSRALTGSALEIPFVARRGKQPGVLIGSGSERLLLGEIFRLPHGSREGVWQRTRSRSRFFTLTPQVVVEAGSPQGCSRVRRGIPPGRTGRIAPSRRVLVSIRRLHVWTHGIGLSS